MRKNLKLLLIMFIFVPVVVCANEEYVNYYGIEMSEEEYNNLLGLGFDDEEIYYMMEDEFNANKDIESSLEAVSVKYYVDTVRYDSLGRVVYSNTTEVTEEEYNDDSIMLLGDVYVETTYKQMLTTIAKAGSYYRYKVTLTWKLMPKVRSYDIIGIGIEPSLVDIVGSFHFNQVYCISNSCTNSSTINNSYYSPRGAGASFKLPTSTSITGIRAALYFDVTKDSNTTLTVMYADGDYAHATSTVTANQATGFWVNQAGVILDSGIENYYDDINAAEASWHGTW